MKGEQPLWRIVALLMICVVSSAASAADDACALLNVDTVSSVLGVQVSPGEASGPQFCKWVQADRRGGFWRNAHIVIINEHAFTRGKVPLPGMEKTPEAGIGDDAYWFKGEGTTYMLSVRKGSHYFQIQVELNKDDAKGTSPALAEQDKAADRKLALEIMKRL
jgi:hypothetical protein